MSEKWDKRMLALAEHIASWSKDPSTQTGAVLADTNSHRIISVGYNGFPNCIEDTEKRLNDRPTKYGLVVHCEMNALLFAERNVSNCTLYTWPFPSCDRCTVHMLQAGIRRFVAPQASEDLMERWGDALAKTKALYIEAGAQFIEYSRDT